MIWRALFFLYLIVYNTFNYAQINKNGFDRYEIFNSSIVGFRQDSFFLVSKGGWLEQQGIGKPLAFFVAFSVKYHEGDIHLFNSTGVRVLSTINALHFSQNTGLFYGTNLKGQFIANAAASDSGIAYYVPENTKYAETGTELYLTAGKYKGCVNIYQMFVPPIYEELKIENEIMVAKVTGKYFLFSLNK